MPDSGHTGNPKRPYTPIMERQENIRFRLQSRDIEILKVINRYRYLRMNQIKRLVFPENRSPQSARKRLKYLFHNRFLGRINPFVQPGAGQPDTAYFLEKDGAQLLAEQCPDEEIFFYGKSARVQYAFLNHALELSEFRMYLEIALKNYPRVELGRFIADFELKSHFDRAIGKNRYKLFHEVEHPIDHRRYVVYPDGLIILKGTGEYAHHQKLYFLEIDRGTEGLRRIQEKIIGYHLYKTQGVFHKFGKFRNFKVLIQTTSPKRVQNMRKALTNMDSSHLVWITDREKVWENSVLHEPIWLDHELNLKSVIKT